MILSKNPLSVIASFLLIVLIGFLGIFTYKYGWQWLDSDYAAEMVLGKLLADENAFLSPNWYYGNEIHIIFQTLFTMPLFKLLGHLENWALIRSICIMLNHIVLVFSYIFMMRQMRVGIRWILITALFLLMPLPVEYWKIVTYSGSYIFFIAQVFFCLGFFSLLIDRIAEKKPVLIPFILFSALSFMHGVQGIRALMALYIPLLMVCLYLWVRSKQKKLLPLLLGSYGFILCCMGFFANHLLHNKYSFFSFDTMRAEYLSNYWQKLGQILMNIFGYFAPIGGSRFLSAHVFFGMIALVGTIVMLFAVIKTVNRARFEREPQLIPVFFAASALFNIFLFIIIYQGIVVRFFIPFMVFYVPLIAIFFEYAKTYTPIKRKVLVSLIVVVVIGYGSFNFSYIAASENNSNRKGYIQYLLDNQLDFGFATYWNANITIELSNGKVEAATLDPKIKGGSAKRPLQIAKHLSPSRYSDPLYYQGESFLLFSRIEWESVKSRMRSYGKQSPDYEDGDFIIVRLPSAQFIHSEFLEN